ncbi:protein CcmH [Pasteurella multocida subsp. multocida OH4807]|nr:protein CcmH [Pasteurella multocida subsp. multocida OH4807]
MRKMIALLCLLFSLSTFATIDALTFRSLEQEKDYHALTQELRCPQCQNNNIADSNATIAVDMRHKVLELLQDGYSKQEVVKYMVDRYGHFVTYDPPLTAATLALWVIPAVFAVLGFIMLFRRKPKAEREIRASNAALSHKEKQRLQDLLKEKV